MQAALFCQISSRKEKHMLKYREGKQCKQNAMSEDGINKRRNERRNEKNLFKGACRKSREGKLWAALWMDHGSDEAGCAKAGESIWNEWEKACALFGILGSGEG